MGYDNIIVFAIRTIFFYRKQRDLVPEYKFTFLCGTLLNVFSTIIPDGISVVGFSGVDKNLPYLNDKTDEGIKEYLKIIRNGIAHKTDKNFKPLSENNTIKAIRIKDKHHPQFNAAFTFDDLEKILTAIETAIRESPEYKAIYTKEKSSFDNAPPVA